MFFMSFGGSPGAYFVPGGGPSSGGPSIDPSSSDCGHEFDEYVKRAINEPFPTHPMSLVYRQERDVEDLWKGRRFRLYENRDEFAEGVVLSWQQKVNHVHYPTGTEWSLNFRLNVERFTPGTIVVLMESGEPKAYRGQNCRIIKAFRNGKYKVSLADDPLTSFNVHEDYISSEATRDVERMNVHGGGILTCVCQKPDCNTNMSLEWIDPPSPVIDLSQNVAKASCPTCRAVEPPQTAFDDSAFKIASDTNGNGDNEKVQTCPICTLDVLCRKLQCNHHICQECWSRWRESATSRIPSDVTLPPQDEKELQASRDQNYQRFKARLPHSIMGGTATRPLRRQSNGSEIEGKVMEQFFYRLGGITASLDRLAHNNDDDSDDSDDEMNANIAMPRILPRSPYRNMIRYWTSLRNGPIHYFLFWHVFVDLISELQNPVALEILWKVVAERSEEIETGRRWLLEQFDDSDMQWDVRDEKKGTTSKGATMGSDDDLEKSAKAHVLSMHSTCFNRIGEICEVDREFGSAIYWYERAIPFAHKAWQLKPKTKRFNMLLAIRHMNLGLAQKKAGLLSKAMENYMLAQKLDAEVVSLRVGHNIKCLEGEMAHWTGNSGRLTPGC